MLQRAIYREADLNKMYLNSLNNPENKYFMGTYNELKLEIDDNDWNKIQLISTSKGDIIGYLEAKIDRCAYHIHELAFINFTGKPNITFSRDCLEFINSMFKSYKFNKIQWSVIVGNPAEEIYDKLIKKYNGRIVGVYKEDFYTYDRELCDRKLYELMRSDYLNSERELA